MRSTWLTLIIVLCFVISSIPSASAFKMRGEWTEVKFDKIVLLEQDWFIDIRMTNKSTLLAGYTLSLDGTVVKYEYFQNNPARGTFSVKFVFESNLVVEGEHELLMILLPFDNSFQPYYYEELYYMTVDVQKTLKGAEFLVMSALILTPFIIMIIYGLLIFNINKGRVENISLINFIPFLISLRKARRDIVSHREGRMMDHRYSHYENEAKAYIKQYRPVGRNSYIIALLFVITTSASLYFFFFIEDLVIIPNRYDTGYTKLPVIVISTIIGSLLIVLSAILLAISYVEYTNRYYDDDIYLTDPDSFVDACRKSCPPFIPMMSVDKELSELDASISEIIEVRENLEEFFDVKVEDISDTHKKRMYRSRVDGVNTEFNLSNPLHVLQVTLGIKPPDTDPKPSNTDDTTVEKTKPKVSIKYVKSKGE